MADVGHATSAALCAVSCCQHVHHAWRDGNSGSKPTNLSEHITDEGFCKRRFPCGQRGTSITWDHSPTRVRFRTRRQEGSSGVTTLRNHVQQRAHRTQLLCQQPECSHCVSNGLRKLDNHQHEVVRPTIRLAPSHDNTRSRTYEKRKTSPIIPTTPPPSTVLYPRER